MNEHDLIEEYLAQLREGLPGSALERDDTLAEVRDHLLETAERLREQGLDARDAQFVALGRLGDVNEFAGLYRDQGSPHPGRRGLAAALAATAIVALGAGVLLTAVAVEHEPELAHRLGLEPKRSQEPPGAEARGILLPQGVPPDARMRAFVPRLEILDD